MLATHTERLDRLPLKPVKKPLEQVSTVTVTVVFPESGTHITLSSVPNSTLLYGITQRLRQHLQSSIGELEKYAILIENQWQRSPSLSQTLQDLCHSSITLYFVSKQAIQSGRWKPPVSPVRPVSSVKEKSIPQETTQPSIYHYHYYYDKPVVVEPSPAKKQSESLIHESLKTHLSVGSQSVFTPTVKESSTLIQSKESSSRPLLTLKEAQYYEKFLLRLELLQLEFASFIIQNHPESLSQFLSENESLLVHVYVSQALVPFMEFQLKKKLLSPKLVYLIVEFAHEHPLDIFKLCHVKRPVKSTVEKPHSVPIPLIIEQPKTFVPVSVSEYVPSTVEEFKPSHQSNPSLMTQIAQQAALKARERQARRDLECHLENGHLVQ